MSSTFFSNVCIFSCNGFKIFLIFSLFCSVNLFDFSSRILFANNSKSLRNCSCCCANSSSRFKFSCWRLSYSVLRLVNSAFKNSFSRLMSSRSFSVFEICELPDLCTIPLYKLLKVYLFAKKIHSFLQRPDTLIINLQSTLDMLLMCCAY